MAVEGEIGPTTAAADATAPVRAMLFPKPPRNTVPLCLRRQLRVRHRGSDVAKMTTTTANVLINYKTIACYI